MSQPSVAIIGGGVAGLVCANRLQQLGISQSTVFDTGKHGPGGRCSSRSVNIGGKLHVFDHSVQYFTVSDSRFAKIVSYLHRKGAVKIWKGKIGKLSKGSFLEDKNLSQAFVGMTGMHDIPRSLAENINVRANTWVGNVLWEDSIKKWKVDKYGMFDYLVIAHNGKCADRLMASAGVPQIHTLTQVRFSDRLNLRDKRMHLCSIWALLVCFPSSLGLKFEGAHVEDEDISWLANNTAKLSVGGVATGSQVECWTVFSTRQFGTRHKCSQENIPPKVEKEVTEKLLMGVQRVTGVAKLPAPAYIRVQLWGAALPLNVLKTREECVFDGLHNVGICGDWLTSPCVQGAAVSGLALAEKIHQHHLGTNKSSTSLVPEFQAADGEVIGAFPVDRSIQFQPQIL